MNKSNSFIDKQGKGETEMDGELAREKVLGGRARPNGKAESTPRLNGAVSPSTDTGLHSWAMVELFGHQRIVGMITVDSPEFPGMIRVDVPDLLKDGEVIRPGHTRYIGRGSVYAVNPCDEKTVRALLPHVDGMPARQASFGAYREDY